jgi:hypothetical protein
MDDLATIRNEALNAVEGAADLGALDAVREPAAFKALVDQAQAALK